MLFVLERRRSRWTKGAIRAERAQRAKQSNRIAPRSAEEEGGDMLSSSSGDEVGGQKVRSALSERSERSNQNCRLKPWQLLWIWLA